MIAGYWESCLPPKKNEIWKQGNAISSILGIKKVLFTLNNPLKQTFP